MTLRKCRRGCWYYLHRMTAGGLVPNAIFALALSVNSCFTHVRRYRGIRVVQIPAASSVERVLQLADALELLARIDSRRLQRVRAQIRFFVLCKCGNVGHYQRIGRICRVNGARVDKWRNPLVSVAALAAVIVHESTHGTLEGKWFPYCQRNRKRIERICSLEAARFLVRAARLEPGLGNFPDLYMARLRSEGHGAGDERGVGERGVGKAEGGIRQEGVAGR